MRVPEISWNASIEYTRAHTTHTHIRSASFRENPWFDPGLGIERGRVRSTTGGATTALAHVRLWLNFTMLKIWQVKIGQKILLEFWQVKCEVEKLVANQMTTIFFPNTSLSLPSFISLLTVYMHHVFSLLNSRVPTYKVICFQMKICVSLVGSLIL
jgi:hypothetical protein